MNLPIRGVAANLLKVSAKTMSQWIKQQAVSAQRVQEQYNFTPAELLERATPHRLNVARESFLERNTERQPIEYGVQDGKPMDTLFTIISPTARIQLT